MGGLGLCAPSMAIKIGSRKPTSLASPATTCLEMVPSVTRTGIFGSLAGSMTCSTALDIMSTSQVESVLVEHKDVAEAAVVPIPHAVKGEALYCFVTMNDGTTFSASTQAELIAMIRTKI